MKLLKSLKLKLIISVFRWSALSFPTRITYLANASQDNFTTASDKRWKYRVIHSRVTENKWKLQEMHSCYMPLPSTILNSQIWGFDPCIASVTNTFPSTLTLLLDKMFKMATSTTDALQRQSLKLAMARTHNISREIEPKQLPMASCSPKVSWGLSS